MKVIDYKIKNDKVVLYLDGEEKLIGNYYFNNLDDIKDIKYGVKVKLNGRLNEASNNTIPHTFNYKKYLKRKGINFVLSIDDYEIIVDSSFLYNLKNLISERINRIDQSGYMKSFIIGDKSMLNEDIYDNYQSIGITHLFALSGMHIGLLSEILLVALKRLRNALKYLIIDCFLVVYGFIVSFPASIQRCIVFYIINSINKIFNLGLNNKLILLLTVCLLIILDPFIIYDVGFLFSVGTVSGIILFSDFIKDDNKIKGAFKLSLIAFLFSMPISLYSFYEVNLLSIIYNMFFIPFVSIVVYPLALLTFILPFLNPLFQQAIIILEWSSTLLADIRIFNICLSLNTYEVLLCYLFLFAFYKKQQKRWICCLLLLIIFDLIIPYFDSNAYVYFLDVRQGDASLIITPHRKNIYLIDTGGINNYHISENYISLLKYLGINNIDYLVLTHGDFDHMGDANYLIDQVNVKNVVFNCGEFNDLELELISKGVNYKSCINNINNDLFFLKTKEYDDENDNSNVIYTKLNNYEFIFMGDASTNTENDILKKYKISNIDVLKVGHHGSRTSSGESFVKKMNPKYSVISVGKNNRYGHPNKEVLKNLSISRVYRTDKDGSIVFQIGKRNSISTNPP